MFHNSFAFFNPHLLALNLSHSVKRVAEMLCYPVLKIAAFSKNTDAVYSSHSWKP